MKIEDIYKELDTSIEGLSEVEAKKRLELNGANILKEEKKKSNVILFLEQFKDFMVILLIFASIFSFFISYIRHETFFDSIIIIVIVIINAILSFVEEKKASNAISALNKMFITNTFVIRDGKKKSIDVRDVVPGDIIELESGDYIAADARIIESYELEVDESTLTGDSLAVSKSAKDISDELEFYEKENMVFASCMVTKGRAKVVVLKTGMNTEIGKIADSLINKKKDITPLQKKMNQISRVLTYIILLIILVMIIIGVLKKNDFFDVLMISISLAVAAIPEGLSSVITIILSIGISEMAKRNVIIRKMSSVETLGSAEVICSDKTGTITENKMTVKAIYINNNLYKENDNVDNSEILNICASCCQDVSKNNDNYLGDQTEVAIYKYLENNNKLNICNRVMEYPFDSERKRMSTINEYNNKKYSFTKGGLDSIINNCKYYLNNNKIELLTDVKKNEIFEIEKQLSNESLRLLAFSYKEDNLDNPEEDMIFIGIMGMMDPPRSNVFNSIETCKKYDIRPIMITGDSKTTAKAIAKSVGIIDQDGEVIEGKTIDKMSDEELQERVKTCSVYARISPNSKLRIVEALQNLGYVVAMTGDGVNDAPAIKKADIGIGMGRTGTEVVKNVADCVLVDDSFSTIVNGVEEGRRITSNIKKVMLYLIAGNIVEVIIVFVSMLYNMEIFTPLQLLWINLITDSIPAIMLAFEKPEKDLMENKSNNDTFFTPYITSRIIISSIFKSIVMLLLFTHFAKSENILVASSLLFIYLIANELLFAFSCRNLKHSVLNNRLFDNQKLSVGIVALILVQLLIFTTPISEFFIVSGIGINNIMITIGVCLLTFIVGELAKPIYRKVFKD